MKYFIGIVILISLYIPAMAQTGPTGIGNCQLWLKADAGTRNGGSTVSGAGQLDEWRDQSGRGNHTSSVSTSPFKVQDNTSAERRMNYNPVVLFDQSADQFIGTDLGMDGATSLSEFYVFQSAPDPEPANNYRGVFALGFSVSLGFNGAHRLENDPFTDSYVIFDDFMDDNLNSAGSSDSYYNQSIKSGIYNGSTFIGYSNGSQVTSLSTGDGITTNGNAYRIGDVEGNGTNNPFSIGEIIIFDSNLNNNQRRRVNSYLAIKYGITLSHGYRRTDNTNIYPVATYGNNIIGLGRQDNSGLYQKQSHTIDDSTRIYLSTLQSVNSDNTGTFAADESFVIIGDDQGLLYSTDDSKLEMPAGCGLYSRLAREWKMVKTNITEAISLDITLSADAIPDAVDISDLRFLVDDDGDFSNGGTTCYENGDGSGLSITYSNPVISISGISTTHLANNSTGYFTIASAERATPLPIELLDFSATLANNESALLRWTTASETNNDFFTIEKSKNGSNWEKVADVAGQGNSTTTQSYLSYDYTPYFGTSYYRLKQTDLDGSFSYSRIISLRHTSTHQQLVYPNPTTHTLTIVKSEVNTRQFSLMNAIGQDLSAQVSIKENGDKLILDLSHLSAGPYLLRIENTTTLIYKQ